MPSFHSRKPTWKKVTGDNNTPSHMDFFLALASRTTMADIASLYRKLTVKSLLPHDESASPRCLANRLKPTFLQVDLSSFSSVKYNYCQRTKDWGQCLEILINYFRTVIDSSYWGDAI